MSEIVELNGCYGRVAKGLTSTGSDSASDTERGSVKILKIELNFSNTDKIVGGELISSNEASSYMSQWKEFRNDFNDFIEMSKVPSRYSDWQNDIHLTRNRLSEYELIDYEAFEPEFLKGFFRILDPKKKQRIRICNGIKRLDQITSQDTRDYLCKRKKTKMSCIVIIVSNIK